MSISHKHNHNKDIKLRKVTLKIYWLYRFPSSVSSPSAPLSPLRTPISTGSRGESSQVRIWETGPGCWQRTTVTWLGDHSYSSPYILCRGLGHDVPGQPLWLQVLEPPGPPGTLGTQWWRGGRPLQAGAQLSPPHQGARAAWTASTCCPGRCVHCEVPACLLFHPPTSQPSTCPAQAPGLEPPDAGRRHRHRREEGRKEGSPAGGPPAREQWTQVTADPPTDALGRPS